MARKKVVVVEEVDPVRAEYEKILTRAIIKHGSLIGKNASFYGWTTMEDYDGPRRDQKHSVFCGIAKTGRVDESAQWYEFMGTFYEGDNSVYGMEVHGVTCNCGRLADRTFRWKSEVGEAIRLVMMELLADKVMRDGQED